VGASVVRDAVPSDDHCEVRFPGPARDFRPLAWAVAPALTVAQLESSRSPRSLAWSRRVANLAAGDELWAAFPEADAQSADLGSAKFSVQPLVVQAALVAPRARSVRELRVPPVLRL
jgi:hypothetical protein